MKAKSGNTSLINFSDNSLKEYFLNSVKNDMCEDTPLIIEEKLRILFSNFMSELSGTMDSFPGTLLESCVSKLSSTVNSTIQEIISTQVIPALYDQVFKHLSEFPVPHSKNEKLEEFVNDKLDSLQDIIIGLNADNSSDLSCVKNSVKSLEQDMFLNLSSVKSQLAEAADKEDLRFEQSKRRMSDFHTSLNAINHKLDFLVNSLQPHDPPETIFNNPLMHDRPLHQVQTCKIPAAEPKNEAPNHVGPEESHRAPEIVREHVPQLEKDFPFIKHEDVDPEMRKELWKSIPKTSDWEKFSGELPYNHELWLKNIDVFVEDYCMLDHMVISRLTALFTDTAKNWYIGIRDSHSKKSWAWWKHTIRNKFGTHNWKWKMQQEFEKDYFTMENKKVHKWFNTQRERYRAFQPEISENT
jgi:hypothetical protein